jgi:hypothetical protein
MLEWQKTGTGPRPKYRLSVKGRHVLGMAGLWAPWMNPKTGKWEDTFAIITSDPRTNTAMEGMVETWTALVVMCLCCLFGDVDPKRLAQN